MYAYSATRRRHRATQGYTGGVCSQRHVEEPGPARNLAIEVVLPLPRREGLDHAGACAGPSRESTEWFGLAVPPGRSGMAIPRSSVLKSEGGADARNGPFRTFWRVLKCSKSYLGGCSVGFRYHSSDTPKPSRCSWLRGHAARAWCQAGARRGRAPVVIHSTFVRPAPCGAHSTPAPAAARTCSAKLIVSWARRSVRKISSIHGNVQNVIKTTIKTQPQ